MVIPEEEDEDHNDVEDEDDQDDDAVELATEMATDDEEVDDGDDDADDGDEGDGIDEVADNVDDEKDDIDVGDVDDDKDDIATTVSDTEATLVADGSFVEPFSMEASFDDDWDSKHLLLAEESIERENQDTAPDMAEVLPRQAIEDVFLLTNKLDNPMDRLLVSLSLCVSLAVMDWAPQLVRPWTCTAESKSSTSSAVSVSMVHRGRWVAVLLLLVWIPVVY
ncbi:hypothetical protein SBRCBS47491_000886 [Sporothrix bragantina]|uniref:Uncharacterized protein n=1 Tax=Sporothrix bragantina TaxID=671064 RepID=A0ABP0AU40_9PEZI